MRSAAEKVVEALKLLPEEMRGAAAAYLLSQAKKFRALHDAVDEGMADMEAARVVPWDLKDFLEQTRRGREAARRLASMGGTDPDAKAPPRRRF
jgi:hypothetical protein